METQTASATPLSTGRLSFLDSGDYDAAAKRNLRRLDFAGNRGAEAAGLSAVGINLFTSGKPGDATAYPRVALDLRRQTGDRSAEASVLRSIADAQFKTGNLDGALGLAKTAAAIAKDLRVASGGPAWRAYSGGQPAVENRTTPVCVPSWGTDGPWLSPRGHYNISPFAVLPDPLHTDGRRMLASRELVNLPSAAIAVYRQRLTPAAMPSARLLAVLAEPVFDGTNTRLKRAGAGPGSLPHSLAEASRAAGQERDDSAAALFPPRVAAHPGLRCGPAMYRPSPISMPAGPSS